jgi:succinate dehydrogenase/fumarate reductase flavoprotein subunit
MIQSYDVVIVGFGFAGGVAAIEAHDAGKRVLLVEKNAIPGGISVCSAGGLRIAKDSADAMAYLVATNGGTTPEPVLKVLADGMTGLADYARELCAPVGGTIGLKPNSGNYPLPGYKTFGFAYVEGLDGFEVARDYPNVRGAVEGARLFEVVRRNVARRKIDVKLGTRAECLVKRDERIAGIVVDGDTIDATSIVLACGGFEADPEIQRQHWVLKPVLSAAVDFNTGDGLRMGQAAGAGLWHMWHYHGSYGFKHPDPDYKFGIRVKRLPDWNPAEGLRGDVAMTWILLDRDGRRFMNEYEPYMQDTGHRPFEHYDTARQRFARVPALMLVDAEGRARYPLSAPTWNDESVATKFGKHSPRDFDAAIFAEDETLDAVAQRHGIDPAVLARCVERWNAACAAGRDESFERPPGSMVPIRKGPFSSAKVWPVVSNTQGGLPHDAEQRVLDPYGAPIPGLYVAGELGSVFGHLYMSGGNIAESFVGGRIAGRNAAAE